jgi:parallel beta-helix repeat protein
MDECKVSLAAYQNEESIVPCIVVEQHGCLIMNRSEVRGGKGTIGVVCKGGQLLIKESVVRDHHEGIGIMIVGKQPTKLIMKNSSILGCWDGLVMNGPFEAIVDNNIFEDCATAGIVIHACNTSKVSNNEIKSCTNGISVYNSFPSIIKNNISDN